MCVTIAHTTLRALLDTGANISALDYTYYVKHLSDFGPLLPVDPTSTNVSAASGTTLTLVGKVRSRTTIGSKKHSYEFLATKNLRFGLVLGTDFIESVRGNVSIYDLVFTLVSLLTPFP